MIIRYRASSEAGVKKKGELTCDSMSDFYAALEAQGLLCIDYEVADTAPARDSHRLTTKELIMFCRKCGTMLTSGMSITNALDIIATTSDTPGAKLIFAGVFELVKGGKPLSAAMMAFPMSFPTLLINMIQSGEETGNVDQMLGKLALYYEKQAKIQQKIKAATTYPIILCCISVVVIVILFVFVLPKIFEVVGVDNLPLITKVMLGISYSFTQYWYVYIIVIVFGIVGCRLLLQMEKVRIAADEYKLKLPILGKLHSKIYSSQFASSMAVLYSSGIPLVRSIRLSSNIIKNTFICRALDELVEDVSAGKAISVSIAKVVGFDVLLSSMIQIGEETGSLDSILISTADYYDMEVETTIGQVLALLEPILLVVMAIIIGAVLISVMLPIFQLYTSIK